MEMHKLTIPFVWKLRRLGWRPVNLKRGVDQNHVSQTGFYAFNGKPRFRQRAVTASTIGSFLSFTAVFETAEQAREYLEKR